MWFADTSSLGRIAMDGTVSLYTSGGRPEDIAAGVDGALWFAGGSVVGRMTTDRTSSRIASGIDHPQGITTGPDGALWFTNEGNNSIGRMTTLGAVTGHAGGGIDDPYAIAAGPDGAMWFTNAGNYSGIYSIGRIGTDGTVTNYTDAGIRNPQGIAGGPDGAMWFTTNRIIGPQGIASGPDGALWYAQAELPAIGRLSTGVTTPDAPTIVRNATAGDGSAMVNWIAPVSDGGSPITGYVVTPYVGYFPWPSVTFESTATSETMTGLRNGTTYRFKVAAINGLGTGPTSKVTNPVTPAP